MPLLYAPYVPSLWEDFILRNRRILFQTACIKYGGRFGGFSSSRG